MSNKMRKYIAGGLVCLLSLSLVACGNKADNNTKTESSASPTTEATQEAEGTDASATPSVDPMTPIAKVGDVEILRKELDLQLGYQQMMLMMQYGEEFLNSADGQAYMSSLKGYIADNLINSELAIQKAEELGKLATDEEVQKSFDEQKATYQTEEEFQEALKSSDMTEEELKEEIKRSLSIQNMVSYLGEGIDVTDEEVQTYYNNNIANYTKGAGANMSHILVATEDEAKKVKEEYDAGTSFEDLAAKYGTDSTKDNGGALGYIEYDSPNYDADFLAGAKTLEEGQVSDPVKTQFGYHLIKVDGVQKEDVVTPFEEVKDSVKEAALAEKKNEAINAAVEQWKKDIKVEKFEDAING